MATIKALLARTKDGALPLWRKRKAFFWLRGALERVDGELEVLSAWGHREAKAHRSAETRRKLLAGQAIAARLRVRPGLERWVRTVLRARVRLASARQLFGLKSSPLLPTERVPVRSVADAVRRAARMNPEERKARIKALKNEKSDLLRQQRELQAADRDDEMPADPTAHRHIVLGAVFLKLARTRVRVTKWLRRLLIVYLKADRDRALFGLDGPGPLVVDEVAREPQTTRRRAPASSEPEVPGPERAEDAASADAEAPVWTPCRIPAIETSSASGTGKPGTGWGARLTGVSAVAALPEDLCGMKIKIKSSSGKSWDATITAVVSRDKRSVIVRKL